MIFVDTNFINRFLLQDIPEQTEIVNKIFDQTSGKKLKLYSTDVVFFEVCWSLKQFYDLEESNILEMLYELIASGLISFQTNELLLKAIKRSENNKLEIVDNYHLVWCVENTVTEFNTFDKKLINEWKKARLTEIGM